MHMWEEEVTLAECMLHTNRRTCCYKKTKENKEISVSRNEKSNTYRIWCDSQGPSKTGVDTSNSD